MEKMIAAKELTTCPRVAQMISDYLGGIYSVGHRPGKLAQLLVHLAVHEAKTVDMDILGMLDMLEHILYVKIKARQLKDSLPIIYTKHLTCRVITTHKMLEVIRSIEKALAAEGSFLW